MPTLPPPLPGLDINRLLLVAFRWELCLGPATLDPLFRVIAWSLNVSRSNFKVKSIFGPQHFILSWYISCVDMFGQPFTGARATKAGSKLHGGSYALVMIRQVFLKKLHCRNVFYECMLLTLIRGDWKWHCESWNLWRHWTWKAGVCFKCFATGGLGLHVYLRSCTVLEHFVNLLWFHHVLSYVLSWTWFTVWKPNIRHHNIERFERTPRMNTAQFFTRAL